MSAPRADSFPWWAGTALVGLKSVWAFSLSCPTAFEVGEGGRLDKGLKKLSEEQGPRKLPESP